MKKKAETGYVYPMVNIHTLHVEEVIKGVMKSVAIQKAYQRIYLGEKFGESNYNVLTNANFKY